MQSGRMLLRKSKREGFTLIELLVVISIIAVLVSLISPAVQVPARRPAARSASTTFATWDWQLPTSRRPAINNTRCWKTAPGRVPAPGHCPPRGIAPRRASPGVAQILGYLDQPALARQLTQAGGIINSAGVPFTGKDASGNPIPVPIFSTLTCPDDANNTGVSGGLSYAANAGYINFNSWSNINSMMLAPTPDSGTGAHDSTMLCWSAISPPASMLPPPPPQVMNASPTDQAIARSTGVFWRNEFDGFRGTTDMVQRGDGLQFTFLLAENINSGFWADITPCAARSADRLHRRRSECRVRESGLSASRTKQNRRACSALCTTARISWCRNRATPLPTVRGTTMRRSIPT